MLLEISSKISERTALFVCVCVQWVDSTLAWQQATRNTGVPNSPTQWLVGLQFVQVNSYKPHMNSITQFEWITHTHTHHCRLWHRTPCSWPSLSPSCHTSSALPSAHLLTRSHQSGSWGSAGTGSLQVGRGVEWRGRVCSPTQMFHFAHSAYVPRVNATAKQMYIFGLPIINP